ncbi:MAG: Stp1/IreP family PP2C-type Ser/Thr phosphatase [bacterium]
MLKEKRITTTTAVYSDVGKVRKANEDSYYISKDENLVIVCDGMGGQVAGGLASKIAVETIQDIYQHMDDELVKHFLYEQELTLARSSCRLIAAVRLANRRIYNISTQFSKLRGMGTTVVALSLDKSFATMVHVGDSRIFRVSDQEVFQLTEDHSWLNELIEDKEINEEQIETFAQKNVITRALGTGPTVKIDIHCEKYKKDDTYILCTDGLHNSVGPRDIKRLFERNHGSLDALTRKLIQKAMRRDGSDNITVAIARVSQDSKDTRRQGLSTTIAEEENKLSQKIDRFIHDNYSEPQLQTNQHSLMTTIHRRRFMVPGLVLLTGLLCFMLGMALQNFNPKARMAASRSGGSRQTKVALPANAANSSSLIASQTQPITRSTLSDDAVLAVVFFNSLKDYQTAQLDERGTVIDRIHPYRLDDTPLISGDFSIFLIDSSNNVIRKVSGVQLPVLQ